MEAGVASDTRKLVSVTLAVTNEDGETETIEAGRTPVLELKRGGEWSGAERGGSLGRRVVVGRRCRQRGLLGATLPSLGGCLRASCVAESSDELEYRVECGFERFGVAFDLR
jgi:hypothetical protein